MCASLSQRTPEATRTVTEKPSKYRDGLVDQSLRLLQVHIQSQAVWEVRHKCPHMGHVCAHMLRMRGVPATAEGHHFRHQKEQGLVGRQR